MELCRWQVREGYGEHEVRVDFNPENDSAVVRVDGRIAARPFDSDHDERELDVGQARYRVVRTGREQFDLELMPGAAAQVSRTPRSDKAMSTAKWPGLLLKLGALAIVLVFVASIAEMGAAYFTPWENFDQPDGAYAVKLPAEPKTYESGGMSVAEVETGDCFYYVGSKRLDRENYKYDDHKMLDEMIRRWHRQGAEIVSTEVLNRRDMVAGRSVTMNYQGEIDGEMVDSTLKVLACSTYDWVVLAVAEYPREGKAPAMKVDRFFRSISLGT